MGAIGIGLLWTAYTVGFYGYCLARNYNVTPKMLLSPSWPPTTVDSSGSGGIQGAIGPNGPNNLGPGPNLPGGGQGPGARLPGGGSAGVG